MSTNANSDFTGLSNPIILIDDEVSSDTPSTSFSCAEILLVSAEDTDQTNNHLDASSVELKSNKEKGKDCERDIQSNDVNRINGIIQLINFVIKQKYNLSNVFKYIGKNVINKIFNCKSNAGNLYAKYGVYSEILTTLIKKWDHWQDVHSGRVIIDKKLFKHFYFYLRANINFVLTKCNSDILDQLEKNEVENVLHVSSTLKNLKTLFYYEPQKHKDFHITRFQIDKDLNSVGYISGNSILNNPFVMIKLNLPGFAMLHQNVNYDKFDLINLRKGYKINDINIQSIQLRYEPSTNISTCRFRSLKTLHIHNFLEQLKRFLRRNSDTPKHIKDNICLVLSEFQKDVGLCKDEMKTSTYYHINLSKYPYVRYLGRPSRGVLPKMFMEDQLQLDNSELNVRLQQMTYPMLSFNLLNFDPKYNVTNNGDELDYIFDDDFLSAFKNKGILYECTLCNKSAKFNEIRFHLAILHGIDPDWACTYCENSFSTKYLSLNRWQHDCKEQKL